MFDHVLIFQREIVYLSHLDSKGENTRRLRLALKVASDFFHSNGHSNDCLHSRKARTIPLIEAIIPLPRHPTHPPSATLCRFSSQKTTSKENTTMS